MAGESYWSYQASSPTPLVEEAIAAGAVPPGTTQAKWEQLSPGFRREIVRGTLKRKENAL
jgi:hypothetical protein